MISLANIKSKVIEQIILHKEQILLVAAISKSLVDFGRFQNPISIIEGVANAANAVCEASRPFELFNIKNGWVKFSGDFDIVPLFLSVLNTFPYQLMPFKYFSQGEAKIIHLPIGDVGLIIGDRWDDRELFYQKSVPQEQLIEFLIQEKFKEIKSNIVSLSISSESPGSKDNNRVANIGFISEPSLNFSPEINKFSDSLQSYFDQNMNRAWLLKGVPGTGKTSLAQALVEKFGLRTLKIRLDDCDMFGVPHYRFLIETFKFQAVIIDDFDQLGDDSSQLLEFLQFLNQKIKLTFIIVNSLKDIHPAILRPGRVDQIVTVDEVEDKTIRQLLGVKLYKSYGKKVKLWPVAFINELVLRSKSGIINLGEDFKELNERVIQQRAELMYEEIQQ